MKIKIISCEKPSFWYADYVGTEFFATDYDHRNYKVLSEISFCLVRMYDCEIISHEETGISDIVLPNTLLNVLEKVKNIVTISEQSS